MVAGYRARASARPNPLMTDPWAEALAGAEGRALAEEVDRIVVDRELWIAVRTATLDTQVERWTGPDHRFSQVVLLGAGLDARAARLPRPGVRYFEVDHPASQRDKLDRLSRAKGYPLEAATYVPCDFAHQDFLDALLGAGFRAELPALVIWEGVTPYLEEAAIRATLRRLAHGCKARTVLLFDHFLKTVVEKRGKHAKDEQTHARVDGLGERFLFGTNDPVPMLFEEGFRHVRSASFDELCLSLTGTYVRAREFRFQRLVLASRTPIGSL
jgi:methyltransferase (TIGR00027 family)